MKKTLYRTIGCIVFAAILAAMGRMFNTEKTNMKTLDYPMQVHTTEHLTAYDITNCRLDLACGQMPDTTQENVILCAAAAFTGQYLDYFEHSNILGQHISNGQLYDGYTEDKDGVPFQERYAMFVWKGVDTHGQMLEKVFCSVTDTEALEQAQEQGGMAFTQHWVIKDKKAYVHPIQPLDRVEHFRSLCMKEGRVYVMANTQKMTYQAYVDALLTWGVENALYMDMGPGWNHSFYRDADNCLHIIHPKGHHYPTNWIVVYRD